MGIVDNDLVIYLRSDIFDSVEDVHFSPIYIKEVLDIRAVFVVSLKDFVQYIQNVVTGDLFSVCVDLFPSKS